METIKGLKRTNFCGDLRKENIGEEVTLMGWAQTTRNLGSLCFIDLRDRTGISQLVVNKEKNPDLYEKARAVRQEYVLAAVGRVEERSSKNPDLPTGEIEVLCTELRLLAQSETPPIYIKDDDNAKEEIRLKYRYLDLRKFKMQEMLTARAEITRLFRSFLHQEGFIEVETPFLGKPTPEGARDYLVPSRINDGHFYALPQSPQLMKQLLMIGGTDRYYQVARCFRDEDLRANRQPEFTQVDLEMSFVTMDDVIDMNERLMVYVFKEFLGIELKRPFPRMTYKDAMENYGTDKPDLRYGFPIKGLSSLAQLMEFPLFSDGVRDGKSIYAINFKGLSSAYTRKGLDQLATYAKGIGAENLLWIRKEGEDLKTSFNKYLNEGAEEKINDLLDLQDGDLALVTVGQKPQALELMGLLRVYVASENLTFDPKDFKITWIVEFPMFTWSEEEGRFVAEHHPFTMPLEEDLPLLSTEPEKVRAQAYDIVINGDERGGGSIRINDPNLQHQIFELLKLTPEDISNRFGFFLEALKYGAPPHGGIAYGLDRFIMMLINRASIKDVIAFPKTQMAADLMMEAPTTVTQAQLDELHIRISGIKEK